MSERDAVVAWLRAEAVKMVRLYDLEPPGTYAAVLAGQNSLLLRLASEVERGDHLKDRP